MKKKHVLMIVENNSVPRDVRVWSEALAAKEAGYEVSVICPKCKRSKEYFCNIEGIRIYRHPMPTEGSGKIAMFFEYINAMFWEYILSIYLFITHRFHVIHSANPPDHVFLIALPFKAFGVKYVFDHHDITPENFVAKFNSRGLLLKVLYLMEWMTFKTADVVVSTNESYKKLAIERGGKKEDKVFVVRNGPNLNKVIAGKPNEMLRKGFNYLIGYVGIIAQQEGIENLLESMKYIVNEKKRTDIKCVVIGTGPHWNAVVKQSKGMGLDKYVEFTGFVPDAELYEILSTVDVCVNPEFSNEFTDRSTMIKIMEYMTFGKPIVQYHTTEGEVSAGESAIYIRQNSPELFADELIALLDDPERRGRMGNAGRARIETKLSWQHQKGNLLDAYEALGL